MLQNKHFGNVQLRHQYLRKQLYLRTKKKEKVSWRDLLTIILLTLVFLLIFERSTKIIKYQG